MREQYIAGPHAGDPGDQVDDSMVLAPEAAALIGADVLQGIEQANYALVELDRLADIEDPFAHDRRDSQVDLGFLSPEFAQIVANYHATQRPFKGIPPRSVAIFGRKLARNMPDIHNGVSRRVINMEPGMIELTENVGRVADRVTDSPYAPLLPDIQRLMDELLDAHDRSPSKATIMVIENAYAAGISGRDYAIGVIEQRGLKFIPRKMGMVTDMLRTHQAKFKEVVKGAGSMRSLGTNLFKIVSELITIEQTKEAAELLDAVDVGKQKLPGSDELEGDQRDTAIAAERYLMAQADRATAIIKRTDPSLLKDPELRSIVGRLLSATITQGQEAGQAERPVTIGNDVLGKLTEAKNILRGGRRLKSDDSETERNVQRTADELHGLKDGQGDGLLDPEESGLIVAMVAGKFEGFAHVFAAVKQHAGNGELANFPPERIGVVRELARFDLAAALTKIGSLLDDPDSRLLLERVLGTEKTRQVHATLNQA